MNDASKAVKKLVPYVCARDLYKEARIFLDANENPYSIMDAGLLKESIGQESINRYPDSDCFELRKALASYAKVNVGQVFAGNGSGSIIQLVILAFSEKGDNVISLQPGFSLFDICANISRVEVRQVNLTGDFDLPVNTILEKADSKTKIVYFPSPTVVGPPISEDKIRQLLDSLTCFVFVDEAYFEFYGRTIVPLVEKYDNLIVLRTLSKAWGLAGLRVGYCIACERVIETVRNVRLPYSINTLSQILAAKVLRTKEQAVIENAEKIADSRKELSKALEELGLTVFPSVTNFLTVRLPSRFDSKAVQKKLVLRGIIVRDRSALSMLENCVRITVGTPNENRELIEALKEIFGGYDEQ